MNVNQVLRPTSPWAPLFATVVAILAGCSGGTTNTATPLVFTNIDGPGGGSTTINAVANDGSVVGFTTAAGVNANFKRNSAGNFTALLLGDPAGMANGINSGGTVVGVANSKAFTLSNGLLTPLTVPGSTASVAFGISDSGVVVGQSTVGTNLPGFILTGNVYSTPTIAAGANFVNVQGANKLGYAVGFYSTDNVHQHGFLYNLSTKKVTLLPDPSTSQTQANGLALTQFLGLNDNGQAVGYYQTTPGSQYGFMFDINSMKYTYMDEPNAAPFNGVQITQITGINDSGSICGFYVDSAGVQHGFIATH